MALSPFLPFSLSLSFCFSLSLTPPLCPAGGCRSARRPAVPRVPHPALPAVALPFRGARCRARAGSGAPLPLTTVNHPALTSPPPLGSPRGEAVTAREVRRGTSAPAARGLAPPFPTGHLRAPRHTFCPPFPAPQLLPWNGTRLGAAVSRTERARAKRPASLALLAALCFALLALPCPASPRPLFPRFPPHSAPLTPARSRALSAESCGGPRPAVGIAALGAPSPPHTPCLREAPLRGSASLQLLVFLLHFQLLFPFLFTKRALSHRLSVRAAAAGTRDVGVITPLFNTAVKISDVILFANTILLSWENFSAQPISVGFRRTPSGR